MSLDPADLDRLLDAELERLSPGPAPQTLLPRVMAALEQRASRPWWRSEWLTWPRRWQAASLAGALSAGALIAVEWSWVEAAGQISTNLPGEALSVVFEMAGRSRAAAGAAGAVWQALLEPVLGYVVGAMLMTSAASAALGAVLMRLAGGETGEV